VFYFNKKKNSNDPNFIAIFRLELVGMEKLLKPYLP
jgi:hypothetical protein